MIHAICNTLLKGLIIVKDENRSTTKVRIQWRIQEFNRFLKKTCEIRKKYPSCSVLRRRSNPEWDSVQVVLSVVDPEILVVLQWMFYAKKIMLFLHIQRQCGSILVAKIFQRKQC